MSTVKFKYSSMKNINFRGTVDSGIEREEWEQMTPAEQDDEMDSALRRLVDIQLVED